MYFNRPCNKDIEVYEKAKKSFEKIKRERKNNDIKVSITKINHLIKKLNDNIRSIINQELYMEAKWNDTL